MFLCCVCCASPLDGSLSRASAFHLQCFLSQQQQQQLPLQALLSTTPVLSATYCESSARNQCRPLWQFTIGTYFLLFSDCIISLNPIWDTLHRFTSFARVFPQNKTKQNSDWTGGLKSFPSSHCDLWSVLRPEGTIWITVFKKAAV